MNASDNRFYREPTIAMSAERDLAEEIYAAFKSERTTNVALELWDHARIQCPHWSDLKCFAHILPVVAESVLTAVLARRQSEAARTGPWDEP